MNNNQTLIGRLNDLHRSELLLVEALTKMSAAAFSPQLVSAFNDHQNETRMQERRLHAALHVLQDGNQEEAPGDPAELASHSSIAPLVAAGEQVMAQQTSNQERDQALVAAAMQVEQHEIAAYEEAISMAGAGNTELVQQLEKSLAEERAALNKLRALAQSKPDRNAERLVTRN